jgi:hypothetical protein
VSLVTLVLLASLCLLERRLFQARQS